MMVGPLELHLHDEGRTDSTDSSLAKTTVVSKLLPLPLPFSSFLSALTFSGTWVLSILSLTLCTDSTGLAV